jgi:GTP-binding protein
MATFVKSIFNLEDLPDDDRPQVALVGRSNVGKSSLVNALGGQSDLARVSSEPGRTRTINFYQLERRYYLVDLPGYGFARGRIGRREAFTKLITDYLQETIRLKFVIVVIDARLGATALDKKMISFLKEVKMPMAIVASKSDKLTNSEAAAMKRRLAAEFPDIRQFFHSTHDSRGRGEIKRAIELAIRADK